MSTTRIVTLEAHPDTVFDALLGVTEELGFLAHVVDADRRQIEVRRQGKGYRIAVSVTDNGLGKAILHSAWTPPGSSGAAKCAKRLSKATARSLAAMEAPPPPPPAP